MKLALETAKRLMENHDGSLDLRGTQITALPDNLTVGGWLDLRGTQITDTALKKSNNYTMGTMCQVGTFTAIIF